MHMKSLACLAAVAFGATALAAPAPDPVALPAPDPVAEAAPAESTPAEYPFDTTGFTAELKRMGDGCGLHFNLPSLKCTDSGTGAIPGLKYDTKAGKCWMSYDGHLDTLTVHHVCASATVKFDSNGYTTLDNKQGDTVIFQFGERKELQDRVEFETQKLDKPKSPDS